MASLSPPRPRPGQGGGLRGGEGLGVPAPTGPAQSQGRAESQLQTLTQKTCLKEPAALPSCLLGQPARPLGPKAAASPPTNPALRPPQGAGGQAPSPAELLTYSARWLCTACPEPSPEPQVGIAWELPQSAAPGPLPQQPHCFPLLGISAIKAVGVASSPELGPPLLRSPRGRALPRLARGGRQGVPPPASKEQQAGHVRKPDGPAAGSGGLTCPCLFGKDWVLHSL